MFKPMVEKIEKLYNDKVKIGNKYTWTRAKDIVTVNSINQDLAEVTIIKSNKNQTQCFDSGMKILVFINDLKEIK